LAAGYSREACMHLIPIILIVMFLLCLSDHKKHPGAGVAVEYGWIIVAILVVTGLLGVLRGCAAA
jgi:hypothetical protein